jgi:tRNA (cmo5U34)-methyltransferase
MSELLSAFSDPEAVAKYADGPPPFVPGFHDLHRMTGVLLAERAPADARVFVLGAGGGLEIRSLAAMQPGWTFCGVDPAPMMLELARQTLATTMDRVELHQGYVEDAPLGPFDAATCLLTLHFLDRPDRVRTAAGIRQRLKPGAPFVAAHCSFPQENRALWLARYAAFARAAGADAELTETMRSRVEAHLNTFTPEDDADILREAGFRDVTLFYAALTWRGWIATAGD